MGARFTIENRHDVTIPIVLSNRNFTVALTSNATVLNGNHTVVGGTAIIDMVGAWNNNNGTRDRVASMFGAAPAHRISNQEAARRLWNTANTAPLNARNNVADFRGVRYAEDDGLPINEIEQMAPRFSGGNAFVFGNSSVTFTAPGVTATVNGSAITSGTPVAVGTTVVFNSNVTVSSTQIVIWRTTGGAALPGRREPGVSTLTHTITGDIVITGVDVRNVGAVESGGTQRVTSRDVSHLARHVIGHTGVFASVGDNRIANLAGYDRNPRMSDVTLLARWLVGNGTFNTLSGEVVPN
jgi:hypothetical protein